MQMNKITLLYPILVQGGLTFFLLIWMEYTRGNALKKGDVKMGDIALRQPNWPEKVLKIGNSNHNQYELPILFYVISILFILTNQVSVVVIALAWIFVLSRFLHVYIHTSVPSIMKRFYTFIFGAFILLLMWGVFIFKLIIGDISF